MGLGEPIDVGDIIDFQVGDITRQAPITEQPGVLQVITRDVDARADGRAQAHVAGDAHRSGDDETRLADGQSVAGARIQLYQDRGIDQHLPRAAERLPQPGRFRFDRAVEGIVAGDGSHLQEPGEPAPRRQRHRGKGGDSGDGHLGRFQRIDKRLHFRRILPAASEHQIGAQQGSRLGAHRAGDVLPERVDRDEGGHTERDGRYI